MADEMKPVRCGCGGEAKVSKIDKSFLSGEFVYGYRCEKCGIATLWYSSEAEAITAWNRAMGADVNSVVSVFSSEVKDE